MATEEEINEHLDRIRARFAISGLDIDNPAVQRDQRAIIRQMLVLYKYTDQSITDAAFYLRHRPANEATNDN